MTRCLRSALHFGVAAAVLLSPILARAGITGSISGTVTDPSGAVISGVTVVVTSMSTSVASTTVTDAKGFYSFPSLNVDRYNITVNQTGFKNFLESGVQINANSAIQIDIKLQVGGVTNTVTVQSNTLQVETQSTQMGDVIEGSTITSVPLNGRSYIDLLALQPGVSPYTGDDTAGGTVAAPISGNLTNGTQSINGGRPEANGFMVNGADAEEGLHNGAALIPNLDSIAEFRIITNNFNAEYGNYSGGQINVVTKSGNNQYHGAVFDFLRNTDLDARNYFSPTRGVFIQNQFGGTFGGPIKKNKVFFFVDYQGTRQILGATQYYPVPSLADRNGDLSDQTAALLSVDPANGGQGVVGSSWANTLSQELGYPVTAGEAYYSQGCKSTSQCVFPNAVIPRKVWSPVAVNTMQYIPTPNGSSPSGPTYSTSAFNETLEDDKGGVRIDATLGKNNLFGYYFADKYNVSNPYESVNIPGFTATTSGLSQMVNLGLTTTINNSTVNDARIVYLRNVNLIGTPQGGLGVSLASMGFNTPWNDTGGIGNVAPQFEGVPTMTFNNYSFGVPSTTFDQYNNTYQVIDNVTRIYGTHSIQFGGDFHYDQITLHGYTGENGQFFFTGAETGLDFADYLIGAPTSFIQGSPDIEHARSRYYGLYAQDSWRARPTLTINYGLRWEASMPWYDAFNMIETLVVGQHSQLFPGAPTGLVVPGDTGIPRTLAPTRYDNFAPRFGLAYSPNVQNGLLAKILGGPGNSSIRAGYGLFHQSIQEADTEQEIGDAPYGFYYQAPAPTLFASPFITRATGGIEPHFFPFQFPAKNVSAKNPDTTFPWDLVVPISGGNYFNTKNVLPYSQHFELSLQRQFGPGTVVSLSYVGTVGRKLLTFIESNPGEQALCLSLTNLAILAPNSPTCGPFGENGVYTLKNGTVINSTRAPFGYNFGSNAYMDSIASSSYNSFQASLQRHDKYTQFMIAYTWSKSMDNGSGTLDATNPYNPALTRALSIFDVPQIFVASYTVQLPFNNWAGTGSVAQKFTAGWALSGITTFASGQPIQLSETDDFSLSGTFLAPVDTPSYANNGSQLYVDRNPRHGLPYFNPNYFVHEPLGQIGDAMRRFFTGPGINNFNLALLKNTAITEGKELQFRAEAFNVFNHAQFQPLVPSSGDFNNTGTGGFGYVTSARDPRIMQVALKFLF